MRVGEFRRLIRDLALVKVEAGATRLVVVYGSVAVKLARGNPGLRCNLFEAQTWTDNRDDPIRGPHLCPVLWNDCSGHVLVMEAALPLNDDQYYEMIKHVYENDDWWGYKPLDACSPFESKRQDWGVFAGQIVAVDYASPVTFWPGDRN